MSYTQQLARLGQDTLANLEALYPGQFVQGMFYEVTDKDTYGIGLGDNSLSLLMTGFDLTDDASQVLTVGHKDVINFEGLNKLKTVKKSDGIQFDFDLTGADDYSVLTKNGTSVEWLKPLTVAANSTSLISISANNEISISQLLAFTKTYDHVATSLADWITTSGYDGTQDTDLLVLDNVSDGNGGVKLEMWMQIGSAGTAADFVLTSVDVTDAYVKALLSGGEGVAYNNTTGAISLSYLRKTGTNVEFNDGTTWDKVWTAKNDGSGSGLDADTVDGIQAARIIYGDNSFGSINGRIDLNTISKSGFYFVGSGHSNGNGNNGSLLHLNDDTGVAFQNQILFSSHTNNVWFRKNENGTWSSWFKLWSDNDFSSVQISNWNTAYGWGNHAGLYSVLGHTHTLSQITDLNSTTDLSEGTNLYYTNARVQSFVNKNYIDNLGVDAATLGGYAASHYLNPSNFNWGLTTNYVPVYTGSTLINSIASQSGSEFRVAGLIRGQAGDTGTFFKSLNSVGVGAEQFYIKHNLANVEIGNSQGKLSLLSNTAGASLELGTQLTSTTNVLISKPNAWLTLDTNSAAPSAEQTTGITIGESASTALHLIYTGDGYGYIGMGALTNNLPAFKSMRFNYLTDVAMFYATPTVNGSDIMHKGNHGANSGFDADLLDGREGSYYTNTSNMAWGLASSKLPYYNGTTLVDSIVSQSGTTATVTGTLKTEGNFEENKALIIQGTFGNGTEHYFRTHGTSSDILTLYSANTKVFSYKSTYNDSAVKLGVKGIPTYDLDVFGSSRVQSLGISSNTPNFSNNVKLNVNGGLISGGTYETSYRNLFDLSSSNTKAQSVISTPLGSNFRFEEDGTNNDAWFYIKPYTTSRSANIIATNSALLNIGTNSNVGLNLLVNNAVRLSLTSTLATLNSQLKGTYYSDSFDDPTLYDSVVGLKTDGTFVRTKLSTIADQIFEESITPSTRTVTATAHGLSQFDVVYFDGTAFQKAIATDLDNARKANEIVIEVIDANTIKLATQGYVNLTSHGFDVGPISYALSKTTAGAVVKEDTLTLGTDVIWRIFRAVDANTLNININQISY